MEDQLRSRYILLLNAIQTASRQNLVRMEKVFYDGCQPTDPPDIPEQTITEDIRKMCEEFAKEATNVEFIYYVRDGTRSQFISDLFRSLKTPNSE